MLPRYLFALPPVVTALVCGVFAGEAPGLAPAQAAALTQLARSLPAKLSGNPLVFIPFVPDAPKALKGDLSDPAWGQAAQLTLVENQTGQKALFDSSARVFCGPDALYIGVRFAEPAPAGIQTEGGDIYQHDALEVFLLPGEETFAQLYYHITLDAANASVAAREHRYPRHNWRAVSDAQWKPAIQTATARQEKTWTAEMKISYGGLALGPEVLARKTLWRLNVFRNRPPRDADATQQYGWSPTLEDSFHTPARFGYLVPAAFASESFLKDLLERCDEAANPGAEHKVSAECAREVAGLISVLGNPDAPPAQKAVRRLVDLARQRPSINTYIQAELTKATEPPGSSDLRARAQEALTWISAAPPIDDDPPPADLPE